MTWNSILDIVLGLALLGWIGYRQLTWTAVAPERMWRVPGIMAIAGVVLLVKDGGVDKVTAADLGVLAIETVISVGLGVVMGLMAHFRPITEQAAANYRARNSSGQVPALQTRTGWLGMALWLVLIATRIGAEFYANMTGSVLLTSSGVILLSVALNRAARIVVLTGRAQRISARAAADPSISSMMVR